MPEKHRNYPTKRHHVKSPKRPRSKRSHWPYRVYTLRTSFVATVWLQQRTVTLMLIIEASRVFRKTAVQNSTQMGPLIERWQLGWFQIPDRKIKRMMPTVSLIPHVTLIYSRTSERQTRQPIHIGDERPHHTFHTHAAATIQRSSRSCKSITCEFHDNHRITTVPNLWTTGEQGFGWIEETIWDRNSCWCHIIWKRKLELEIKFNTTFLAYALHSFFWQKTS